MQFKEAIEKIGYEKEYMVINETDRLVCVSFTGLCGMLMQDCMSKMFLLIDKLLEYGFVFIAVEITSNCWCFRKEKVDPRVASNSTMMEWMLDCKGEIKPIVADATHGMRRGE